MVTILRESQVDLWAVSAVPLGLAMSLVLDAFAIKPDPARPIGWLIEQAGRGTQDLVVWARGGREAERWAGLAMSLLVVGLVAGLAWLMVVLADSSGGPISLTGRSILIAWGSSIGRIGFEMARVTSAGDLDSARRAAIAFTGLESMGLDESGIRLACVRSIGERANRLVIAPLFWLAIGGPAGLWGYLAVDALGRQLDSRRIHPRAIWSGPARLDELVNLFPDRLTWLLIALSATLLGEDGALSFQSGLGHRDWRPSRRPGAWGLAALLGALGLRPDDPGGSRTSPVDSRLVFRAMRILGVASLHAFVLAVAYGIMVRKS